MSRIFPILLCLILFGLSFFECDKKKQSTFTENDTIKVLSILLNDKELNKQLSSLYKSQSLKIVRNKYLKKDYFFKVNNRLVIYTDVDSTDNKSVNLNWKKTLFYLNIMDFKLTKNNEFVGHLKFNSIGVFSEFIVCKENEDWKIKKLNIGQF